VTLGEKQSAKIGGVKKPKFYGQEGSGGKGKVQEQKRRGKRKKKRNV